MQFSAVPNALQVANPGRNVDGLNDRSGSAALELDEGRRDGCRPPDSLGHREHDDVSGSKWRPQCGAKKGDDDNCPNDTKTMHAMGCFECKKVFKTSQSSGHEGGDISETRREKLTARIGINGRRKDRRTKGRVFSVQGQRRLK
jgi:hypothetical protein